MKPQHYLDIEAQKVEMAGAKDVTMRIAVGKEHGAPNFVMRIFTVAPGGHSPRHTHSFEHENYFIAGKGELFLEGQTHEVGPGFVALVPPDALHQFTNTGDEDLVFVCLVPGDI